jgi:hypothetical protein
MNPCGLGRAESVSGDNSQVAASAGARYAEEQSTSTFIDRHFERLLEF